MPSTAIYLTTEEFIVWSKLTLEQRKKYMSALIVQIADKQKPKEQDDPTTDT